MMLVKRIAATAALGIALLLAPGLLALPAQAGYVVMLKEIGNDVVATGSGPIDPTGLTFEEVSLPFPSLISPFGAVITTGLGSNNDYFCCTAEFQFFMGPEHFGEGFGALADSSSGDFVGIIGAGLDEGGGSAVFVPQGYASGDPLSSSATWANQSFSSLGVIQEIYVWTWGTGENQNFTLVISPTAVPEPSSVMLLGVALAGLLLVRARRRSFDVG